MSFLIDQNEPEELDYWCSQSYEVKRGNWNQSGRFEEGKVIYPDITVVSNKIIGVNRKQAVEWMAGFSAWKDQVLRELNGPIDFLIQVIEGAITSTPREGLWGWDLNYPDIVPSTDRLGDLNGNGLLTVGGHVSNHDYKNLFGELIRISDSGIPTFFTGNTFGTALFLVELHKIADQEDWEPRLLTQLVKEKFLINEREIIRRNLILFLMGIPGVGQSVATTLVDYFGNFDDLYTYVSSGLSLASIEIKGAGQRKRTIGQSLDGRIRSFWGLRQ